MGGKVLDLLNAENFEIHEVTQSDFERWLKDEYHDTHPITLTQRTFPQHVMDAIGKDHHKSRDGVFSISFDFYSNKWWVKHPGYVRECEASGDTYLEAASNYLLLINRENARFRFSAIEDAANERLPRHLSVELGERSLTLYECAEGENETRVMQSFEVEGKSVTEVVDEVNRIITEYSDLVV